MLALEELEPRLAPAIPALGMHYAAAGPGVIVATLQYHSEGAFNVRTQIDFDKRMEVSAKAGPNVFVVTAPGRVDVQTIGFLFAGDGVLCTLTIHTPSMVLQHIEFPKVYETVAPPTFDPSATTMLLSHYAILLPPPPAISYATEPAPEPPADPEPDEHDATEYEL